MDGMEDINIMSEEDEEGNRPSFSFKRKSLEKP